MKNRFKKLLKSKTLTLFQATWDNPIENKGPAYNVDCFKFEASVEPCTVCGIVSFVDAVDHYLASKFESDDERKETISNIEKGKPLYIVEVDIPTKFIVNAKMKRKQSSRMSVQLKPCILKFRVHEFQFIYFDHKIVDEDDGYTLDKHKFRYDLKALSREDMDDLCFDTNYTQDKANKFYQKLERDLFYDYDCREDYTPAILVYLIAQRAVGNNYDESNVLGNTSILKVAANQPVIIRIRDFEVDDCFLEEDDSEIPDSLKPSDESKILTNNIDSDNVTALDIVPDGVEVERIDTF